MTFGLSAAAAAAIAVGTAAVGAGISSALGSRNQRKAADRQNALNRQAKFIDGSLTDLAAPTEVVLEGIQGSNATGVEEAIAAMDYEAQMQGENVPIPAGMGENPMGDLSEEELMLLMESPELMGLGGGQQTQYAASGGAVGRPEDVYYFGIPQIMGMMQDPNPQIQGVGMQLADQMERMPDAGMVPATANQIQTMAMGGAVTAKKFDKGGSTGYDQDLDAAYLYRSGLMEQLNKLNTLVEEGIIGETTADQDRQQIMSELLRSLNPDEINLETLFDADKMLSKEASPRRNRLDENLLKELSTESEDVLLDGLRNFDSTNVEQYKGILDSFDFPQEQESSSKRQPSDKDLQNFHERYGLEMSNGGPITSERLNQLRRR